MKFLTWFVVLAAFLTAVSSSKAQPTTRETELTSTEKWVIAQVTAGKIADLSQHFSEKKLRVLQGAFLENLLTDSIPGVKSHRSGVRIFGAIINDPLDLSAAELISEIWLIHCRFAGRAVFERATATGTISFNGSVFEEDAIFNSIRVAGNVLLEEAVFGGLVDFAGANIDGSFDASEAQFKNNKLGATFNGMKVGHLADFEKAVFQGRADFIAADVIQEFQMNEAQFKNKEQKAVFTSMKVGVSAQFERAEFEGAADFRAMDVTGAFLAVKAQFNNKEQIATFNSLKVGKTAAFDEAVFEGPVNFVFAEIGGNFHAGNVQFRKKEKVASFSGLKVGQSAFYRETKFAGGVDFAGADIGSELNMNGSQFGEDEVPSIFSGIKVGAAAYFQDTLFVGRVNFTRANINDNFDAERIRFRSKEQRIDFNAMKIGGQANFRWAIFEGPVSFHQADIVGGFLANSAEFRSTAAEIFLSMKCGGSGDFNDVTFAGSVRFTESSFHNLDIANLTFSTPSIPLVDLSRASIKGFLSVKGITIQDLLATSLHVEGLAELTDVIVEQSANLDFAEFAVLDLSRSVWPREAEMFHFQGMSYKFLRAAPTEPASHDALLRLADQAAYTADVYGNLEAFFFRQGYNADADRAFIAGKQRERREYLSGPAWLGSWLLDWLVGYGRHPSNAGYFCAIFVGLGCLLFPLRKMERRGLEELEPDEWDPVYSRFWYSLGLFLPFVDLQANKLWKPKRPYWVLRNYVRVHILAGWILIPILLAALTGIIK